MFTVDEFKTYLENDVVEAEQRLVAWQESLRATPVSDHQAAHDAWQVIIECANLCHHKSTEDRVKRTEELIAEIKAVEATATKEELAAIVKKSRATR